MGEETAWSAEIFAKRLLIACIHRRHQWELLDDNEQTPIDAGDLATQWITIEVLPPDMHLGGQFPEQQGFDQGIL